MKSRQIVNKFLCVMLAAMMITGIFSGCGSDAPSTTSAEVTTSAVASDSSPKPVTLKYYCTSALNKTEIDTFIAEFNKEYPEITIDVSLITDGYTDKIKMAMLSGEQVDVIETSNTWMDSAAAKALYYPLDDFITKDGTDLEKQYGGYAGPLSVNGVQYGLPRSLAPQGVWINTKDFDTAGVPYPTDDWTIDQFFDTAKKLTVKDAKGNTTRFGALHWSFGNVGQAGVGFSNAVSEIALYGGWEIVNAEGKPDANSPVLKKSLELFYNATTVDKSMPSIADVLSSNYHFVFDLYKNKWSMLIGGRHNPALFMETHKVNGQLDPALDDDRYKLIAMPRWDENAPVKQASSLVNGDAISKTSENPEAAYKFIKWHSSACVALSSQIAHRIPADQLLDSNTFITNWAYYTDKGGAVVKGKDRPELFKQVLGTDIKAIYPKNRMFYPYVTQMDAELEKYTTEYLTGEKNLDKALEDLNAALQKIYDTNAKK